MGKNMRIVDVEKALRELGAERTLDNPTINFTKKYYKLNSMLIAINFNPNTTDALYIEIIAGKEREFHFTINDALATIYKIGLKKNKKKRMLKRKQK